MAGHTTLQGNYSWASTAASSAFPTSGNRPSSNALTGRIPMVPLPFYAIVHISYHMGMSTRLPRAAREDLLRSSSPQVTYTTMECIDIAGLVKGASKARVSQPFLRPHPRVDALSMSSLASTTRPSPTSTDPSTTRPGHRDHHREFILDGPRHTEKRISKTDKIVKTGTRPPGRPGSLPAVYRSLVSRESRRETGRTRMRTASDPR